MKVFVAGASGRVGQELVSRLAARGYEVIAASRNAESRQWPTGVVAQDFDFHADVETMTAQVRGSDAVVFTAGSRGKDLLQTDAFGAVKLMRAAAAAGISRFIMLSSIFSLQPEKWEQEPSLKNITDYNIAKFFADEWLTRLSGLEWTLVQPSVLEEEAGTGLIELYPQHDGSIPIPDVAEVLARVLDTPSTVGKVLTIKRGDEPIADALARA
ncbi:SDR family oxidoreductase [Actinomyces sp. 565]|uniref:SDR family oxidoreductase n=1 Tax=Actinomyces sp. 565 TaxID=2057794 RepID=UPI0013A693ED|nr:SDR family oxidoreductase [Actinomyces sp. 565]NDR54280.1 SDR family oxidoreductase [Actinomyces sp. 565]